MSENNDNTITKTDKFRNKIREDTEDEIEMRFLEKHDNERASGTAYVYAEYAKKHDFQDGQFIIVSYSGVPTIAKCRNMNPHGSNEWRLYLTSNFTQIFGIKAKERVSMKYHGRVWEATSL